MVGRNILESPISEKYEVIAPNRSELDLLNSSDVYNYIEQNNPSLIIHAAGKVGGIKANMGNNYNFYKENLEIGNNIIFAAKNHNVLNFLNLGSSCMYPREALQPMKEDNLMAGKLESTNEGYAMAKVAIAKLCEYISEFDIKFNYRTLIPCNLYGKYDKFDSKNSHMIPSVIRRMHDAKENNSKISMWGNGDARREFMHISDFINFIDYALTNFSKLPQYLNVGIGKDYSIKEYYNNIAKVLDYKNEIFADTSEPIGMPRKQVEVSKLNDFGWQSSISIYEGLKETYAYYRSIDNEKI